MIVLIAAIVGFLAGRMLWLALRRSWSAPSLQRENYQGVSMPTAAGITLALALLLVEGVRAVVGAAGIGEDPGITPLRSAVLAVVLGFSILGLIDDLAGAGSAKGFTGHLRALARGELTTGGVKLIGGAAVGLTGAALLQPAGVGELVMDAAVIALAANLLNMFDVRPGRASKFGISAFVVMAVLAAMDDSLAPVALVVGAAAALVLDDLRERLMLGDTGANALGAALGLGLVSVTDESGTLVALVSLIVLNLASELVSFTKVIEKVPPLRAFDEMGRRRSRTVDVRDTENPRGGDESALRRQTSAPVRATVGSAHEGTSAGFVGVREQSPFAASDERQRPATPSAPAGDDGFSDDLFGLDRRSGPPLRGSLSEPFGDGDDG